MVTSPLTLEALLVRGAQFVFYALTLTMLILAARRFGPGLFRKGAWTKEDVWLLVILGIPRALLTLTIPLNANEVGGDAMTYLAMAGEFPSGHLAQAGGYPYLLGIGLRLLSGHIHADAYAVVVLQHAVGLLTALLLFRWIRPTSKFQAWFTAVGWGLLSSTIFSEHVTRPEFFVAFLLCLTIALIGRYESPFAPSPLEGEGKGGGGDGLLVWVGIAFGWAVLGRGNALLVLVVPVGYLYLTRRARAGRWLVPTLKFGAATVLVIHGYMVLNHYPATGLLGFQRAIIGNMSDPDWLGTVLTTDENPHVRELLDYHHDIGAYLRHLRSTGKDLSEFVPIILKNSRRRLVWPELEGDREAFQEFRRTVDDSDLVNYKDLSHIEEFYPYPGKGPPDLLAETLIEHYAGFETVHDLHARAYRYAILHHPALHFRNVVRHLPLLFFQSGMLFREFLVPPPASRIHVGEQLPLGFVWGEGGYQARGLVWIWGLRFFRGYSRLCEGALTLIAWIFPLALVGTIVQLARHANRRSVELLMGLGVFLAYMPVAALGGASTGRLFLPVYPFIFQIMAFAVSSVIARRNPPAGPSVNSSQ